MWPVGSACVLICHMVALLSVTTPLSIPNRGKTQRIALIINNKTGTVLHVLWVAQGVSSSILSALWAPQCCWVSLTAFCWWLCTPYLPETHTHTHTILHNSYTFRLYQNVSSPNKHWLTSCICWRNLRASRSSTALARALRFFTRLCRMASTLISKGPMMMAEGIDLFKSSISLRCSRTSCFTSWTVWFSWLCNLRHTQYKQKNNPCSLAYYST